MSPIAPAVAVLLVAAGLALATPVAFAHGGLAEMPVTFASGVRMVHAERVGVDSALVVRDFTDLAQHAARLATFAAAARSLSELPPAALAAPARGEVSRVVDSLLAVTAELVAAAGRSDSVRAGDAASRLAPFDSTLDAHVVKRYSCPMNCEPGKTYDRSGDCPVCGMHLKLVTDERYRVRVTPDTPTIRAGVPVTLSFLVMDPSGYEVTNLEVVHEKLLHLIVVSSDLSWFQHVHPVRESGGRFSLRLRFPAGGTYTLFHDFTPAGVGMQVVPVDLVVEGARRRPVPLVVDDRKPRRIDGYDVRLTHTWLAPGLGCGFAYWINRHGKPVTDLEPYLGAMGHLVIVSEDRATYIHSHPLEMAPSVDWTVQFSTMFPKIGRYKAWAQFQRHGRVLTVPFTIEVTNRPHDDAVNQ